VTARETVKRLSGAGGCPRLFLVAASSLILLGTGLRLLGYFGGIEFWWDEALWAMRIVRDQPASIRPVGYVWVSRLLIDVRNTEPVLRSPSLLAGVLSLPAFLAVGRRAGLSRLASLFGLFVLAVHPAAIDLTKEFKPYALELFLHLLLLWLAFSFLRTQETKWLVWTCLVAAASPLFSWSVVVLYPGLFATVALSTLRRRRVAQLVATVVGALAALGVVLVGYAAQHQGHDPNTGYWGEKYGVFYTGSDLRGQVSWLLHRTHDVASLPARLDTLWPGALAEAFLVLQVALCLLGLIAIFASRRWHWVGLCLSPWMVTVALNLLGWWPYGAFRTNLFLLAYSLLMALAGVDGLRRWIAARRSAPRSGRWIVPAFCGAFVLAFLPLDVGFFAKGKGSGVAGNCHVHRALRTIYEVERDEVAPEKPRRLLLDPNASGVYSYYRKDHAVAREEHRDFLRERYRRSRPGQPLEEAVDRQADRGFWLLACKAGPAAAIRQHALERCAEVDHLEDFRHGGLLLRCRGAADRSPRLREGR
jgi:hypothetical protein